MSSQRLEWKVGLFVLIGLVALGGLLINFTKGLTAFRSTYTLKLETATVGGLKRNAPVLLAGVQIGVVESYDLSPDNKSVFVTLKIFPKYKIHGDAVFTIEPSGFLGDQYVSITPTKNVAPFLKDGDLVRCESPFNIQDAARSALGLINRVDKAVEQIQGAVARVDRTVLSEESLTNASAAVLSFHRLSEQMRKLADQAGGLVAKADDALVRLDTIVQTNAAPAHNVISNLLMFSAQLNKVADELETVVTTNRMEITTAVRNVETATAQVTNLLAGLQSGKGIAGALLRNDQYAEDFRRFLGALPSLGSNANTLITNANAVFINANQLFDRSGNVVDGAGVLVSNLNRYGLFYGFLVKPKPPKTNAPTHFAPLLSPHEKSNRD